jgi:PIN domain nuclease of toxin-antitoxin system
LNYVLDASAKVAYLNGEAGGLEVRQLLMDPDAACFAHAVNLCEVFYGFIRNVDEQTARNALTTLYADGVAPRPDMNTDFWMDVGRIKARGRIALGDCFCVALARAIAGTAVTTDHGEFDPLVSTGICPILFVR